MGTALHKLVEIGSEPLAEGSPTFEITYSDWAPSLSKEVAGLLSLKNGFYAFASALHVLSVQSEAGVTGIVDWNLAESWKQSYAGLADKIFCFAQDIFGNQFALYKQQVVIFNCETGELGNFAQSLEDWASKVLLDYNFVTGHDFARSWQSANRPLKRGERLFPVKPFIIGGDYSIDNLKPLNDIEGLRFFGHFCTETHRLPDGSFVSLSV